MARVTQLDLTHTVIKGVGRGILGQVAQDVMQAPEPSRRHVGRGRHHEVLYVKRIPKFGPAAKVV